MNCNEFTWIHGRAWINWNIICYFGILYCWTEWYIGHLFVISSTIETPFGYWSNAFCIGHKHLCLLILNLTVYWERTYVFPNSTELSGDQNISYYWYISECFRSINKNKVTKSASILHANQLHIFSAFISSICFISHARLCTENQNYWIDLLLFCERINKFREKEFIEAFKCSFRISNNLIVVT